MEDYLIMMTNDEFLNIVKESFVTYLNVGTSRSTAKLKTLHGHIASDLKEKLGEGFSILSQGYGNDFNIDNLKYSKSTCLLQSSVQSQHREPQLACNANAFYIEF